MNKSALSKILIPIVALPFIIGAFYLAYNYISPFEDFVDITEEKIVDYINTLKPQESS